MDENCWQCGRPASAEAGARFELVADSRRGLAARGFLVQRGTRQDKVRITVPRCRRCRSRSLAGIVIVLAGAVGGGIAGAIAQGVGWADAVPPPWLQAGRRSVGNAGAGVGGLAGFVAALLGVAVNRRLSGRRSLNSHPDFVRLRREGWHYPGD